jgi:hypothetical protein
MAHDPRKFKEFLAFHEQAKASVSGPHLTACADRLRRTISPAVNNWMDDEYKRGTASEFMFTALFTHASASLQAGMIAIREDMPGLPENEFRDLVENIFAEFEHSTMNSLQIALAHRKGVDDPDA